MPTAVVLLDLSAAFDTIDHIVLLNCLSSWFGLNGLVLDCFASYPADIYQCVKVGDILSDSIDLIYGVPQGSVHFCYCNCDNPNMSYRRSKLDENK